MKRILCLTALVLALLVLAGCAFTVNTTVPVDLIPEARVKEDPAIAEEPAITAEEPVIDEDGSYTSKEDVALYLHTYGKLPYNFITKKEAQKLGWSGGSLDALYDVLTSIPQEAVLQIAGWPTAETALGDYARRLRRTLDEAAEENENLTVEFC